MRDFVKFLLGDEVREISELDMSMTVLEYLREVEGRTGTKEGCAEGDCGACTVVLARPKGGRLDYQAVNSCIQLVPVLDGKQLITVEDLCDGDDMLHPVQRAMVEHHGSQCGFCTPGIVMSLFALYRDGGGPDRGKINDALAGNLCRCTGYGPIAEAARSVLDGDGTDRFADREKATLKILQQIDPGAGMAIERDGRRFFAPGTVKQLGDLLKRHKDAVIVAGLTDVGLWVTKQHRELETVIYIGNVKALATLRETKTQIEISAAVTYGQAHGVLAAHYRDLGELIRRLGSVQIRNVGTICGNIANGSPIGDMPPALIALDARLVLRGREGARTIPLEDFFLAYGKQDIKPGEFVEKVIVPKPKKHDIFRCYKLAKRFDQDISTLCGAFSISLANGNGPAKIKDVRICFGGMAATPRRAHRAERAILGGAWNEAAAESAIEALAQDYTPITDMRGSQAYRLKAAQNLMRKFFIETSGRGQDVRILAAADHAGRDGA